MTTIVRGGLIVIWTLGFIVTGPVWAGKSSSESDAYPSKAYVDSAHDQLRTEIANLRAEMENAYKTITILQDRIAENTDRLKSICLQQPDLCR